MCITYIISLILIKTPQSYILLLYPFKWWGNWVRKQFFALKHRASMRLCQNFNTGSWLRSQSSFICLYIPSSFPSIQHVQQIFSESLLCFRLFFFLATQHGMWDLNFDQGLNRAPGSGSKESEPTWSKHWTAREVPCCFRLDSRHTAVMVKCWPSWGYALLTVFRAATLSSHSSSDQRRFDTGTFFSFSFRRYQRKVWWPAGIFPLIWENSFQQTN